MDLEPRPRAGRTPARRQKDISHLYISSARRPGARVDGPPPARRALELAIAGPAAAAVRSELAANLAVQLARLGRRTVVVDLDPALPNVGFRLGLEPAAYLGHLLPEPRMRLEPALLGVHVAVGIAGGAAPSAWPEELQTALRGADCRLFVGGDAGRAREVLRELAAATPQGAGETTFQRAAARSPMIGAWLATAQRPRAEPPGTAPPLTVALWVLEAGFDPDAPTGGTNAFGDLPVRTVLWGAPASPPPGVWARVPDHPRLHLPLAAVEPEHPVARAFEGLAQSLLAGSAHAGGPARV